MPPAIAGLLAGLALLLHLLWVLFLILGGFLFLRTPRVRLLHLGGLGAALAMQWRGVACPLTLVEQEFLRRAGRESYEGSFLIHYLGKLVYPAVPFQWITLLTVLLLAATLALLLIRPLHFSRS